MNVDNAEAPDGSSEITDLRSVGTVMIKMLTRVEINNGKTLRLPTDELDPSENYTDCERFLEIASKEETNLKSYRKQLLLLKDVQLATWKWKDMPSEIEQLERQQLERCRILSYEVGLQQPSVL